jgi:hypothetical protein
MTKRRPDLELGQLKVRPELLGHRESPSLRGGALFGLGALLKSAPRTFGYSATTIPPNAKRRPDLESRQLKVYPRLSDPVEGLDPRGGALFGLGALLKSAPRTFRHSTTSIVLMTKRRPDLESGQLKVHP